jgi:hypothetical protein
MPLLRVSFAEVKHRATIDGVLVCTILVLVWQEQELQAMNGILVKYSAECVWILGPLGVPTRPFSFSTGHVPLSLITSFLRNPFRKTPLTVTIQSYLLPFEPCLPALS